MEKERHNARGDRGSFLFHADGIGNYLREDDDASEKGDDRGVTSKSNPKIIHRVCGELDDKSPEA